MNKLLKLDQNMIWKRINFENPENILHVNRLLTKMCHTLSHNIQSVYLMFLPMWGRFWIGATVDFSL